MKTGIELIAEERARQVSADGWTPEHDDEHSDGQMAEAASVYAMCAAEQAKGWDGPFATLPSLWPWDKSWFKPKDELRNLVRAGALIAAEIDRVQRFHALMSGLEADACGYGEGSSKDGEND